MDEEERIIIERFLDWMDDERGDRYVLCRPESSYDGYGDNVAITDRYSTIVMPDYDFHRHLIRSGLRSAT